MPYQRCIRWTRSPGVIEEYLSDGYVSFKQGLREAIYTPECVLLLLCPCMLAATIYFLSGVSPTAYIVMCSSHESIPFTGHIYSCGLSGR